MFLKHDSFAFPHTIVKYDDFMILDKAFGPEPSACFSLSPSVLFRTCSVYGFICVELTKMCKDYPKQSLINK